MCDIFGRDFRPSFRAEKPNELAAFIYDEGCIARITSKERLKELKRVVRHCLEQRHADPNRKDYREQSPLHWAAFWGWSEIVAVLVKCKSKNTPDTLMNPLNRDGVTPLQLAIEKQHYKTVKKLLHYNAVVSQSAIDYAMEEEDDEMVKLLLPVFTKQSKVKHAYTYALERERKNAAATASTAPNTPTSTQHNLPATLSARDYVAQQTRRRRQSGNGRIVSSPPPFSVC